MSLNRNMFMNNRQRQAPLVAQHAATPPPNPAMTAAKGVGTKVINDSVVSPTLSSIFAPAATAATGAAATAATGAAATGAATASTGAATAAGGGMMAALGPAVAAAAPVAIPLLIAATMFGRKKK